MRVHCENAMALARALATHPRVEAVHYPGLESHAGHDIAQLEQQYRVLVKLMYGRSSEKLDHPQPQLELAVQA